MATRSTVSATFSKMARSSPCFPANWLVDGYTYRDVHAPDHRERHSDDARLWADADDADGQWLLRGEVIPTRWEGEARRCGSAHPNHKPKRALCIGSVSHRFVSS